MSADHSAKCACGDTGWTPAESPWQRIGIGQWIADYRIIPLEPYPECEVGRARESERGR